MQIELIRSFDYQRQRWKNGLGWTLEIARHPPSAEDYAWRVSIADIDQNCAFSAFPGYRRSLVLLRGEGMELRFADGNQRDVLPPHGRIDFAGDLALDCHLIDGPTRDFNLIWRPERVEASLHHRPLVGSMLFFPQAGSEWLIYLLAGHARIKDGPEHGHLTAGDTLRILADDGDHQRLMLDGAGEVLVVKLSPPQPAAS